MTLFETFMHYFVFKLLVILLSPLFLLVGIYLAIRLAFWSAARKLRTKFNSMGETTDAPDQPPEPTQTTSQRAQDTAARYELAHRAGLHLRAGKGP